MRPGASTREIECWFDFSSNYSYLSVMRIEPLARDAGVRLVWRPFLLGPIFKAFGWSDSPFIVQKEKGEYVWKDMVRLCAKYGIPWNRPTQFPRLGLLAMRVMLLAQDRPWAGEFARRAMTLNFHLDRDINSPGEIGAVLEALQLPSRELLEQAQSEPVKLRLREQTELARARGIFGAPTFFVRGEMFWGNDRLDDAMALASDPAAIPPAS